MLIKGALEVDGMIQDRKACLQSNPSKGNGFGVIGAGGFFFFAFTVNCASDPNGGMQMHSVAYLTHLMCAVVSFCSTENSVSFMCHMNK